MSNISKCENCGCEKIDVIHKYKGFYVCPKCGRDTERLYEIDHDAEIRAKAIDDFTEKLHNLCGFEIDDIQYPYLLDESRIDEIAEKLKGY